MYIIFKLRMSYFIILIESVFSLHFIDAVAAFFKSKYAKISQYVLKHNFFTFLLTLLFFTYKFSLMAFRKTFLKLFNRKTINLVYYF